MALLDVGAISQAIATLLDDPGMDQIDQDYCIPFINLNADDLFAKMLAVGLQYSEDTVILNLKANTCSLNSFMTTGSALAALMQPISIDWKLPGQPDTEYDSADRVPELDDFPQGSEGVLQFAWKGGSVRVTPSAVPLVLRVRYNAMSTTLVDPVTQTTRGAGNILAYYTAELMYSIRGNDKLSLKMQTRGDSALDDFLSAATMASQSEVLALVPTHGRRSLFGQTFTMPLGTNSQ